MKSIAKRLSNPPATGSLRIEDALADSELRYRRLFETAKDGILILDERTGQITEANPFLQELLGYSRAELLGRTLWEIGPFRDIVASRRAFGELRAREYVRYENLPLETKNHERRQVEFVSNVYLVNGQKVIQCNIRDITDRRVAEENIHKKNEDLQALVAELQRRDREMHLLSDMNELLQSCTTQEEAFQVITLKAGELFPGQSGCLALLQTPGQVLEPTAHWGQEPMAVSSFALQDCWALRRGHPHEVTDPLSAVLCRHFTPPITSRSLCVPLTVQGETLGVLCLVGAEPNRGDGPPIQLNVAITVGETIKLVLSNLRLRERMRDQANHDPLTGLFNRRYLDDSLSRELSLSQRRGSPLSVVMLDIDHFKRFNDRFGHEAGDLALHECARVLAENLRRSDIACRVGGEEFALILPDSSLADTRERVKVLCALVARLELRHDGQLLGRMTLSAGIAGWPEHADTGRELLSAADAALYAAKAAGRDQVVVQSPNTR